MSYSQSVESPLGRIALHSNGTALTHLDIGGKVATPQPDTITQTAAEQLAEYFDGQRTHFDLPLAPEGTAFQESIWSALQAIPYGDSLSYGELGLRAGRPGAARAVGAAVGANPLPIVIPCHRVLASDRKITGYSGGDGIPTKKKLLALEGISYR
ncbi:methylated-DNA--[protein]-cysteine S-methyltransferase [Pontimonas sp.]|nr:methylated-DNA--[protein]-cysteine S-methyltransferase [Pontimonas sp.]